MSHDLFITCAKGIAPFLASEITTLGLPVTEEKIAGVWTKGSAVDVMRLNLHLRTGMRVLMKLGDCKAEGPNEMYNELANWPWENWLPAEGYLCVNASVKNPQIKDTRFANMRAKDAIVDRLRAKTGQRPDSGPKRDGMVVFIHWLDQEVTVFLDTSGHPLSRRSYRHNPWKAPMQEALAAACILASGWDRKRPFVNPMCGSGTLGIEAAWLAMNRAPGIQREHFGFQYVYGFEERDWDKLRSAAIAGERPLPCSVVFSDRDPGALRALEENLERAQIRSGDIDIQQCDYRETRMPSGPGAMLVNPPYGERLGKDEQDELLELYRNLGRFFKERAGGYRAGVFSGNPKLAKQVGLKLAEAHTFFNGAIECRLNLFDVFL